MSMGFSSSSDKWANSEIMARFRLIKLSSLSNSAFISTFPSKVRCY